MVSVCIGISWGSSRTLSIDGSKVVSELQSMSEPNPEDFEGVCEEAGVGGKGDGVP